MKELSTKLLIEMLESMLEVYLNVTRLAKQTDEFRDECKQAIKQIKQLISQSERQVDEKYIEEKANELYERCMCKESVRHTQYGRHQFTPKEAKDFIRSIVQEIQKPRKEEK